MVLIATQSGSLNCEMVGLRSAGSAASDFVQILAPDVQHQANAVVGLDGAVEQHRHILDLFVFPGSFQRAAIGDEPRGGFEQRSTTRR